MTSKVAPDLSHDLYACQRELWSYPAVTMKSQGQAPLGPPSAPIMIHSRWGAAQGQADDLEIQAEIPLYLKRNTLNSPDGLETHRPAQLPKNFVPKVHRSAIHLSCSSLPEAVANTADTIECRGMTRLPCTMNRTGRGATSWP